MRSLFLRARNRIAISDYGVMWVVCRLPCKALSFSENAFDDWHLSCIISERELTLNFAAMTDHDPIDKKALSERDICTKFITPAIKDVAGWDLMQFSEEFTLGKIFVKGKRVARGSKDRADYILFHNRDLPIAIIEAKDNHYDLGAGMQQALRYAEMIDVPFAYSSNGDGFIEHDRTRAANRSYASGCRDPDQGIAFLVTAEKFFIIVRQVVHHVSNSYRQMKWRVKHVFGLAMT